MAFAALRPNDSGGAHDARGYPGYKGDLDTPRSDFAR